MSKLFGMYSNMISDLPELSDDESPNEALKLWENEERQLSCYYAPFEHVNKSAKIVLIGITPGRTQMNRALKAASHAMKRRINVEKAIADVKRQGSFSGKMRPDIISILNKLKYHEKLRINCSSELWSNMNHLVNFCSLLKYPVFVKGKDYSGYPRPLKVPELKKMIVEGFVEDLNCIPVSAELVPLGSLVAEVLSYLDEMNLIPQKLYRYEGRIVAPPHPSGANRESISLLTGENYPKKDEYLNMMYLKYLKEKIECGKKPLDEQTYKSARASRWEQMLFVRRAYGINA